MKNRIAIAMLDILVAATGIILLTAGREPKIRAVVVPTEQVTETVTGQTASMEEDTAAAPSVYVMTPDDIAAEEQADELEELAICVEAEAGNQDLEGKRLVVDVILNRVDAPEWPDTIKEVIEQYPQFSSYWNGHMAAVWSPADSTYEAIRMEMEHRSNPDIFYFTAGGYGEYGTPWKQVGDHYFSTK